MGFNSVWHWLILLAVVLIVFGGSGKISSIMGDVAKGIKSFKKGMADDEPAAPAADPFKKDEPKTIDGAGTASQGSQAAQTNKVS